MLELWCAISPCDRIWKINAFKRILQKEKTGWEKKEG